MADEGQCAVHRPFEKKKGKKWIALRLSDFLN